MNRRDLNAYQRIEVIALHREPIEKKRAEQRKLSGLKQGDKTPMAQIHTYGEEGRLREILAPAARVGDNTYYKGSWLVKNAPEEIKQRLRQDDVTIESAFTSLIQKTILSLDVYTSSSRPETFKSVSLYS